MAHLAALQALNNPVIQKMVAEQGAKLLQKNIDKFSPQSAQQLSRQSEEEEEEEEKVKKKKKKGKKKKNEEDEEEEEEEEDEDEKEERLKREKEDKLAVVDSSIKKFYNIDKENALKFKKAYYESEDGMIDKYKVFIDYNNVKAIIFKIKKKNNKIFSIKIMAGTQSTEIPRRRLMIDGHPVDNRSIINKIIEVCANKENETETTKN